MDDYESEKEIEKPKVKREKRSYEEEGGEKKRESEVFFFLENFI